MHVVLDFNPVLRHRYSGFRTYGAGLLDGLVSDPEVSRVTLLCSPDSVSAGEEIPAWHHRKTRVVAPAFRLRRWERWWRLVKWPALQHWCGTFDVYHSVHHLMPPTQGRPRIVTVHDLRRYRLPELYAHSKVALFQRSVAAGDRIIAISHATKTDLVELLGVPEDKIDVVHLATPGGFSPASEAQRERTLGWLSERLGRQVSRYAVTIVSRDARKNLRGTIRGFARARSTLPPGCALVVVGDTPRGEFAGPPAAGSQGAEDVLFTGTLDQEDWIAVLASAEMFLFLSLYEGFGLPMLEAMASGTPVIASNTSSLPEVAGEAALLVDPTDADEIARAVVEIAQDPALRRSLADAGIHRAAAFTWARVATETIACYRRAVEPHPR